MTTPASWRPATGADSVPFPAMPLDLDSPEAQAAFDLYMRRRDEAERRETADEAIVRCRAEAEYFEGGAARFDDVLDTLLHDLDRHVANEAKPGADVYRGFSMGESCFYGFADVEKLARTHAIMADAWEELDHDAYRKAAAEFSKIVAELAIEMRVVKSEGGAA